MTTDRPRTRFAPSPTGQVHIGNIRTAIYNWLYARRSGGAFLLRVEDTDRERSTPEAVQAVTDAMAWLGLDVDEDPVFQSTRMEAHLAAAEDLLTLGRAYKLDKGDTGQGEAVLFRMPGEDMSFDDQVKGALSKKAKDMQDFVIVRSNGTPVFHLANVVDDIHMNITHVIRGDDHVENTYRHLALYRALGAEPPKFAHLPMIVNPQGKPYSKRDGDAYVGDFQEQGYLPEALFNYLTLLGWSPGDDREVLTREEMAAAFDLAQVQSSAARFDFKKLDWMNGEHLRALPEAAFVAGCREALGALTAHADPAYTDAIITLMRERIRFFKDLPDQAGFFFTEDFSYNEKAVRKRFAKPEPQALLRELKERLASCEPFDAESLDPLLHAFAEEKGVGPGQVNPPLRVAVTGQSGGPDLTGILELLGRERVLARIDSALARFPSV